MFFKRRPRKKTFVNARIQGRIIGRIAAYWVLYHIVLWHGMFVFRYAQHRTDVASGGNIVPFKELYGQFVIDYYPMVFCAVLILPIFMIDFVRMTHRIAGPLVRFRHVLNDLMEGKRVKKVGLRKGDLLTEFEEDFNRFLEFYNAKQGEPVEGEDQLTDDQAEAVASIVEADADGEETRSEADAVAVTQDA